MLLSMLKFVQGFLQVTLTGSSPERFLNLCIRRNILIWNLCPNKEAGGFDFCISLKGFRASKELLKKTHTTVKIRKKCGLPFFLHRYRARKLFAIGILLCVLLLWNCSKYRALVGLFKICVEDRGKRYIGTITGYDSLMAGTEGQRLWNEKEPD